MKTLRNDRIILGVALALISNSPTIADTTITVSAQPGSGSLFKDIALVIVPAITALFALYFSTRNTDKQITSANNNASAQRWREANQKEIEQLELLLRTFHMPFLIRSETNRNMARDLRNRIGDPNYRLLVSLFDPNWLKNLPDGDRALANEICGNAVELKKFIDDNSGSVDSKLADHLARAATHFRILRLAYEGKLGTNPSPFRHYVYPRQLDLAIEVDRLRITERLAQLRANPSKDHGAIKPLELPQAAQLTPWPDHPSGTPA